MNDLVASRVCWTIAIELADLVAGLGRVRRHEPLDDLGLQDDVGQALGGAVVHRPGDLAPEVFLRAEQQAGDGRRDAARVRGPRPAGADLGRTGRRRWARRWNAAQRLGIRGERIAVPAERPSLALEDVDLRFHQRRALGQQDELGVEVRRDASGRAARRTTWRSRSPWPASRPRPTRRDLVAGGLRLRLGDEQVHLGELGVEVREVVRHPPGQLGQAGRRRGRGRAVGHRRGWSPVTVVDQSSGIRIQPWRIA